MKQEVHKNTIESILFWSTIISCLKGRKKTYSSYKNQEKSLACMSFQSFGNRGHPISALSVGSQRCFCDSRC